MIRVIVQPFSSSSVAYLLLEEARYIYVNPLHSHSKHACSMPGFCLKSAYVGQALKSHG